MRTAMIVVTVLLTRCMRDSWVLASNNKSSGRNQAPPNKHATWSPKRPCLSCPSLLTCTNERIERVAEAADWPLSLFHPDKQCAIYLKAKPGNHGLGHVFMDFNYLVTVAALNGGTLISQFTTSAHGVSHAHAAHFFFGDTFMPHIPADCNHTQVANISQAPSRIQRLQAQCSTDARKCMVVNVASVVSGVSPFNVAAWREIYESPRQQVSYP